MHTQASCQKPGHNRGGSGFLLHAGTHKRKGLWAVGTRLDLLEHVDLPSSFHLTAMECPPLAPGDAVLIGHTHYVHFLDCNAWPFPSHAVKKKLDHMFLLDACKILSID